MVRHVQTYHGAAKISPKQWDKIWAILDKLAEEPTDAKDAAEVDC
jgi:hypothetical protein